MSGGSFNYLYVKAEDFSELYAHRHNLQEMAERLSGLGYAKDAALETERIIALIERFEVQIEARAEPLAGVWKAVEWWVSGDGGEDDLRKALAEYRDEAVCETCHGSPPLGFICKDCGKHAVVPRHIPAWVPGPDGRSAPPTV